MTQFTLVSGFFRHQKLVFLYLLLFFNWLFAMGFWIKKFILMFVLLGIAGYVLLIDEFSFSSNRPNVAQQQQEKPQPKPKKVTSSKEQEEEIYGEGGTFEMTTSSAATGLSRFYGKVKEELLGNNKTVGDGYVIKLKPSIFTLDEQLQRRGAMVQPGSPKFTGETTTRHFRQGQTIRNQLIVAAQQEGMELIWQLERDYIIKHYFKVNADLLSTLSTVAKALNSDFEKHVYALYCFNQRAVVITHDYTDYVKQNCRDASTDETQQLPG